MTILLINVAHRLLNLNKILHSSDTVETEEATGA
jgi:hypothetical protein